MKSGNGQVVFLIGEGNHDAKSLGGKGAGLAAMKRLGVEVPAGFTVSTTVARAWFEKGEFPQRFGQQLENALHALERQTGKRLGDPINPLLVSVRSGAAVSMPGMMDTVLNLGLTMETVEGLAKITGQERFAWDCYMRFLEMFGETVLCIPKVRMLQWRDYTYQPLTTPINELTIQSLKAICKSYLKMLKSDSVVFNVIDDPMKQLVVAISSIFESWNSKRAEEYRRVNNIPNWCGTAVTVQAMVFGNLGEDSCSGVVFSRNVNTGAPCLYGEFLVNAQGEDQVAGTRTPVPIAEMQKWNPDVYAELEQIVQLLERYYNDIVDVEFTVEKGRLHILQVRIAKYTAEAAITTAVHRVWNKQWTKDEALKRITAEQIGEVVEVSCFDPQELIKVGVNVLGNGIAASDGCAVGTVAYASQSAIEISKVGIKVILVTQDTSPDDLEGMMAASAIVTETGGATCHAAVVARSLGKPAVVGLRGILSALHLFKGNILSVDGTHGVVYNGKIKLVDVQPKKEVNIFLRWHHAHQVALQAKMRQFNFDYLDERVDVHTLINDFYLSTALTREARGTPFAQEARILRDQIHKSVAERLAVYLLVAIAGELRHYGDTKKRLDPFDYVLDKTKYAAELHNKYDVSMRKGAHKFEVQMMAVDRFKRLNTKEQLAFLDLAIVAFREKGVWDNGYGAEKWAHIAETLRAYIRNEWTDDVFVDHAFDLQHNGGCLFDKHRMMNEKNTDATKRQLKLKKIHTKFAVLFDRLEDYYYGQTSAVIDLCKRMNAAKAIDLQDNIE